MKHKPTSGAPNHPGRLPYQPIDPRCRIKVTANKANTTRRPRVSTRHRASTPRRASISNLLHPKAATTDSRLRLRANILPPVVLPCNPITDNRLRASTAAIPRRGSSHLLMDTRDSMPHPNSPANIPRRASTRLHNTRLPSNLTARLLPSPMAHLLLTSTALRPRPMASHLSNMASRPSKAPSLPMAPSSLPHPRAPATARPR